MARIPPPWAAQLRRAPVCWVGPRSAQRATCGCGWDQRELEVIEAIALALSDEVTRLHLRWVAISILWELIVFSGGAGASSDVFVTEHSMSLGSQSIASLSRATEDGRQMESCPHRSSALGPCARPNLTQRARASGSHEEKTGDVLAPGLKTKGPAIGGEGRQRWTVGRRSPKQAHRHFERARSVRSRRPSTAGRAAQRMAGPELGLSESSP